MEGQKQLPEEMASNSEPFVLCPSCMKGGIKFNYYNNEGECDTCGQEFNKRGNSIRFM
jgi:uncharacterized CHY-type Zn-finger protein